ncbi:YsnF/AvaK domain-containing protein [Prosthecomicrobium sp. N25]|uniref:YsnF/AvaK domain-containing protein n=1 Tax=Prosthecomicrobium sp. N25 TaxID=3129254 RepID=UPI003076F2B4
MMESTTGSGRRTLTAFYDRMSHAEEAMSRLRSAGIAESDMRLVQGTRPGMAETSVDTTRDREPGFWESLADLFLPDEDRHTYAEGLSRGGYLLTVTTQGTLYDTALDIMDDEGTVDMEERSSTWRSEGWTGTYAGIDPTGRDYAGRDTASGDRLGSGSSWSGSSYEADRTGTGAGAGGTTGLSGTSGLGTDSGATRTGTSAWSDRADSISGTDRDSIPVIQEELRVGKRDVEHGRVRVRSYVVEEPVETSVGLRSEHVQVERRPVDRPADASADLFRERTIEASERAEEAVVSKDARVVEEVSLRKDVQEEQRRVSDTVRKTEVEVDDERSALRPDGTRFNR